MVYSYTITTNVQPGIAPQHPVDITVFPNPFSDILKIKTNAPIDQNITLTIRNLQGQLIYLENTRLLDQLNINLSRLPSGIYHVNILTRNESITKQIIKE